MNMRFEANVQSIWTVTVPADGIEKSPDAPSPGSSGGKFARKISKGGSAVGVGGGGGGGMVSLPHAGSQTMRATATSSRSPACRLITFLSSLSARVNGWAVDCLSRRSKERRIVMPWAGVT
jgi:hypothetical protein